MTIGIPGGHFFLSPLHSLSVIPGFSLSFLTSLCHSRFSSPSFPTSLCHSWLLSVIPAFPLRHSRLDRESLSKKFKTFQKKKNFLSEKEKYLIGYCLRPISS